MNQEFKKGVCAAVGWAISEFCSALDRVEDPRELECPAILEKALKDLDDFPDDLKNEKTKESYWFHCQGYNAGFVISETEYSRRCFIGVGSGIDQKKDEEKIRNWGSEITPGLLREIIEMIEERKPGEHDIQPVGHNGELGQCSICKAAEGELPSECPGRVMSYPERQAVFKCGWDYKNGTWIEPAKFAIGSKPYHYDHGVFKDIKQAIEIDGFNGQFIYKVYAGKEPEPYLKWNGAEGWGVLDEEALAEGANNETD